MLGKIFIDIPKAGFPRKIEDVPVFQEEYVCNLKECIEEIDMLVIDDKIQKEIEGKIEEICDLMEDIIKDGIFTIRSVSKLLQTYYKFLTDLLCLEEDCTDNVKLCKVLSKSLLLPGITIYRKDVYTKLNSFPVLTALFGTYACMERISKEDKRFWKKNDIFLKNIFMKLFPSSFLSYIATLKTDIEIYTPPKPNGSYMDFTGVLPENIAKKIKESLLYYTQENNKVNSDSSIVVFVYGPCDKKQILQTAICTSNLLKRGRYFIQTELVFIIPEHLPLPDIDGETTNEARNTELLGGMITVCVKHGENNILANKKIMQETLNNCDILVMAGDGSNLENLERTVSNVLVTLQSYTFGSFRYDIVKKGPQSGAKYYIDLCEIILSTTGDMLKMVNSEFSLCNKAGIMKANEYICNGDVRAKNMMFLYAPDVWISKEFNGMSTLLEEDSFTGSFIMTDFGINPLTEIPLCADDDIIFSLLEFQQCIPEAEQFVEKIVTKFNTDNIYIKINCKDGVVSWNPVIVTNSIETQKFEMIKNSSRCCLSQEEEKMFYNIFLSVYGKSKGDYEDFWKSRLFKFLYDSCRSIVGLMFCQKLKKAPETAKEIMQTKEVCYISKPPEPFKSLTTRKLFYELIHELDKRTPSLIREHIVFEKATAIMELDVITILKKIMQACEIVCYDKTPLYSNAIWHSKGFKWKE